MDPRDFIDKELDIQGAVNHINKFLEYDGYEIVAHGKAYDVIDKTRGEIFLDIKLEPSHLSHQFIKEQFEKYRTKSLTWKMVLGSVLVLTGAILLAF